MRRSGYGCDLPTEPAVRIFNLVAIASIIALTFVTVTLAGTSVAASDDGVADAAVADSR